MIKYYAFDKGDTFKCTKDYRGFERNLTFRKYIKRVNFGKNRRNFKKCGRMDQRLKR